MCFMHTPAAAALLLQRLKHWVTEPTIGGLLFKGWTSCAPSAAGCSDSIWWLARQHRRIGRSRMAGGI